MQKLDRSRTFGNITPPFHEAPYDRPAYFEQDGKLFDAHDRLIEPGKPIQDEEPPAKAEVKDAAADMSPATLLANAGAMTWAAFRKRAKEILGETCPAGKGEIIEALKAAIQHYEARQQKRSSKPAAEKKAAGLTWGKISGEGDDEGEPEPENLTAKPSKPAEIDLAAWARGQKDYLFGDIRKLIRAKYHASVTERRDALSLLIDEKVIQAAEARKDIT